MKMKKAIIVVSFGTTHADAERNAIVPVENAVREAFADWEIHRAWTARKIVKILRERGENAETEAEALARLRGEGYDRIVFASTHMIPGEEYAIVREAAGALPVSAPLLSEADDLDWMAGLLGEIAAAEGRTLLVMGHGTNHGADETYARLRARLPENVKLACVEGKYGLDGLLPELERLPERRVTLTPLMLVAGDHAHNDLAGEGGNSWKSVLEGRGFDVRVRMRGLGTLEAVQRRIVEKVRAVL